MHARSPSSPPLIGPITPRTSGSVACALLCASPPRLLECDPFIVASLHLGDCEKASILWIREYPRRVTAHATVRDTVRTRHRFPTDSAASRLILVAGRTCPPLGAEGYTAKCEHEVVGSKGYLREGIGHVRRRRRRRLRSARKVFARPIFFGLNSHRERKSYAPLLFFSPSISLSLSL